MLTCSARSIIYKSSTLKDNLFVIEIEKGLTPQLVFELAKTKFL